VLDGQLEISLSPREILFQCGTFLGDLVIVISVYKWRSIIHGHRKGGHLFVECIIWRS